MPRCQISTSSTATSFEVGGVRLNAEVRVGRRRLQKHFAKHLGPEIADLVDLAGAVYLADRLCRRRGHRTDRYEPHWCRRIHVSVPVRKPGIWTDPEVGLRLRELLAFMTEDHWNFSFYWRDHPDHVTFPFSAMRAQVRCLRRALRASDPWAALVMRFPALDQTAQALQSHRVPAREFRENTLRLYDRHCSEWQMVFGQPRLAASGQPTRGTA